MEPFRSSGSSCPSCSSPLREFNKRLVCDRCEGMMLAVEDYASSLHDLDGSLDALAVRDAKADTAKCPRCGQALQSCALAYGDKAFKERYLACERDGLWVSNENMLAAFARVSRAGSAGGGGLANAAAQAYMGIAPAGSATGAARGIGNAFGARAVRHRRDGNRPRAHSEFVSAFRGRDMKCPACTDKPLAFEGDRWACEACHGSFVEDAALVAMVSDIKQAPWELPQTTGPAGTRGCPACSRPMVTEKLGSPTIDRCTGHGIWFDDSELAAALVDASAEARTSGIGGWLKRLFA